jgi:F-type H+-transporting ATPase subunit delta
MKGTILASRYAKSLLTLAIQTNALEQVKNDMKMIFDVFQENRDLRRLLKSPIIKSDKKQAILKELFGSSITKISLEFLNIITFKRREHYLGEIARQFVKQYNQYKGIEVAIITTASKIDDKLRQQILKLVKTTNDSQSIELVEKIDRDIIGGFVLTVGDKEYDASLSSRIRELKQEFAKNLYIRDY